MTKLHTEVWLLHFTKLGNACGSKSVRFFHGDVWVDLIRRKESGIEPKKTVGKLS